MGAVRPDVIVVVAPERQHVARMRETVEGGLVQTLIAQPTVETHGVAVEVIPGVTTASAAAAQFGFSLTQRGSARRVLFATGRTLVGADTDWTSAADAQTTLCLYMGGADIADIAAALVQAGREPETPALAAIDVERTNARLVASTLSRLSADLDGHATSGPVFIAIGQACASAIGASLLRPRRQIKKPHLRRL